MQLYKKKTKKPKKNRAGFDYHRPIYLTPRSATATKVLKKTKKKQKRKNKIKVSIYS